LRKVLGAIGARVLDRELPVPHADEQFDADGKLSDPEVRRVLEELLAELVRETQPALALAA
jgi:chromate reductase